MIYLHAPCRVSFFSTIHVKSIWYLQNILSLTKVLQTFAIIKLIPTVLMRKYFAQKLQNVLNGSTFKNCVYPENCVRFNSINEVQLYFHCVKMQRAVCLLFDFFLQIVWSSNGQIAIVQVSRNVWKTLPQFHWHVWSLQNESWCYNHLVTLR